MLIVNLNLWAYYGYVGFVFYIVGLFYYTVKSSSIYISMLSSYYYGAVENVYFYFLSDVLFVNVIVGLIYIVFSCLCLVSFYLFY